jgi:hypothetical protein
MSSSARSNIIKRLQSAFPRGRPIDVRDLTSVGVYPALAYRYVQSGWLERLGRGVFMFAGDQLQRDPSLGVLARRISGLHVGGKTALAWRGLTHNVAFRETLSLWGPRNVRLPPWFTERFACRYTSRCLFDVTLEPGLALSSLPESPGGVAVSEPERGLLEMLSDVGLRQEVEEARSVMEMTSSLRPEIMVALLRGCRQTKTMRLCILWSKELGLPWAEQARDAVADQLGNSRWIKPLPDGKTLILRAP